jgi:hypothetical protein
MEGTCRMTGLGLDACVRDVLIRGLEDWVDAAEVAWVARSVGGATADGLVCDLSIGIISEVLQKGLMVAGDVTDNGFKKWNMTSTEALDRITREWKALGRSPHLGEICWLSNTSKGDGRAQSSS